MTWQRMISLGLSLLIVIFHTGNVNLFRPPRATWTVPRILHRALQIEEVRLFIKNVYFGMSTFNTRMVGIKLFCLILATDINEAVLEGAKMLNVHPRQGSASILILLTDGDPTTGYNKHTHAQVLIIMNLRPLVLNFLTVQPSSVGLLKPISARFLI